MSETRPARVVGTLLLVEQSAPMRALLVALFRKNGYDVYEAAGTEDALEQLEAGARPDVVLADVGVRGDGALLSWIRARSLPTVVVLTVGLGDLLEPEQVRALGATAVVAKPLDLDELLRLVRELCPVEELVA